MKLAILAARSDIHTVRWVNAIAGRGHDVYLLTSHPGGDPVDKRVHVHALPFSAPIGYFLNVWRVRQLLKKIQPDLLHAHYASGYGTLGRLSGYHPYVLSVWGKDVYEFPYRSRLHLRVLIANLRAADHVCSTSHVMAGQTQTLCSTISRPTVTPFGIDTDRFYADPGLSDSNTITIGTVKKLRPKYGVDILIRAFATVHRTLQRTNPERASRLHLLIVGGGPEEEKLRALSREVGVDRITDFTGRVPHAQVPIYLNRLDVYVAVSRADSESFGVAILEASACELPVVVSDVGGLPEVVDADVTGMVVERENVEDTAEALLQLIDDSALRADMGEAGRQHVLTHYDWEENVSLMEQVYAQVVEGDVHSKHAPA